VVNVDDPQGASLLKELRARRPDLDLWPVSVSGGTEEGETAGARLRATNLHVTARGMSFEIAEANGPARWVDVPFIGAYNVSNLLGVVAALRTLGHGLTDILGVLPALSPVPGRMETFGGSGEPLVLVDYAHTPDALEKALLALRPIVQARGGRLCCVFGCGGDRDRSKRPLMGSMASRLADSVVLTSDNPRSEDPERILNDIRAGVEAGVHVQQQADRRLAILDAVSQAGVHDVVLVAGKGHEDYQEIRGVRHPCRDADLVRDALAQRPAAGFLQLGDVATALRGLGLLQGDPALSVGRVHTDTRSIQAGDLYVALRGERFDGHDFLKQAQEAGAVAAVAEQGLAEAGMPGVAVHDSLQALQALARDWRAQLQLPLIAVAGSNGKTTVTQMVASILRAWVGERAGHTRGNLNNHIGVPLSVLSLRAGIRAGHQAAVLELGMNHPGEIELLAGIAQPTVALVNNAQREHQEFMHTVEAVARENGAVLSALPPGGAAVFPADDEYAPLWADLAAGRRLWRFKADVQMAQGQESGASSSEGAARLAEVNGSAVWQQDHWALSISSPVGSIQTTIHMPGRHNVHNAMAAASAALAAGAPLEAVVQGLREFRAVAGRSMPMTLVHHGRHVTMIDDSYNANPDSVRAAIDVLADLQGPRLLILGDMGEVGEQGPAFHVEAGEHARRKGIEQLWCLGALSHHAAVAFGAGARHFESMAELTAALGQAPNVQSILVKGSRFMRMEQAVKALQSIHGEAC
jgi:murE/murF fusion protein